MTAPQTFVIVGGGLAAGKAVQELRESGFDGHLVLYGEEAHPPYERPPLSKGYLMGDEGFESALVQPLEWYDAHDVDLRLGTRVAAIDPATRTVTAGGAVQGYDKLLLATGARPRHLAMADDSGAPVAYLRSVEDSDLIRSRLRAGRRLVIIGGGWIGLEVAAAARRARRRRHRPGGHEPPPGPRPGPRGRQRLRGPPPATRRRPAGEHRGRSPSRATAAGPIVDAGGRVVDRGRPARGRSRRGTRTPPSPAAAGLQTDNGILVDDQLRTSASDVFAAGDVANAYHPLLGRHLRVEHWDNAIEQGVVAAQNMLGKAVSYDRLPYFFSDQYDLGMEYVGNVGPDGYDQVVLRGKPDEGTFTAFWLKAGRVLAGMHANDWDAMDPIRRIVARQRAVPRLDDESLSLTEVADSLD